MSGVRLSGGRVVEGSAEGWTGSVVDAEGLTLLPGWIDLQVNGAFGIDLSSTPEGLWDLAAELPATGVTAFLPTLVSPDPETVARAIDAWAAGPPPGWTGSVPLGWHVEGPFIAPSHRGTHPATSLRPVDTDLLQAWASSGAVRLVTLAPELAGAAPAIARLVAHGVVVAAGHSGASADQAQVAFDAGVRAVTHVFNAMPPLHHRDPGLVGAALADPRVVLGVIGDGLHLAPLVLRLLHQTAGPDRIALVTDAMAAAGLGEGRHRLGNLEITVGPDGPRNADGGLAGSAATYDKVVRTWRAAVQPGASADHPALAQVTSATAAALLGEGDRGHLSSGARADVTGVDADGRVVLTIVGGQILHHANRSEDPQ